MTSQFIKDALHYIPDAKLVKAEDLKVGNVVINYRNTKRLYCEITSVEIKDWIDGYTIVETLQKFPNGNLVTLKYMRKVSMLVVA